MEEIRCPMCSKLNPAENEKCQYCNARLKPLVIPGGDADESGVIPNGENDAPDWINRLTTIGKNVGGEIEEADNPGEGGEAVPDSADSDDWLARLQMDINQAGENQPIEPVQDQAVEESTGQAAENQDADLPDWLRHIRSTANREITDPPLGVPVISPGAQEEASWLERLRNQNNEQNNEQAEKEPFIEDDAERVSSAPPDEPAWLHAFPFQKDTPAENILPPSEKEEMPDWLAGAQPVESGSESISDWSPTGQAVQPSEIPDWLGNETPSRPTADQPADEPEAKPAFVEGSDQAEAPGGKPDWLRDLESRAPSYPGSGQDERALTFDQPAAGKRPGEPGDSFVGGELPDWLANFGPAVVPAPAPENAPTPLPEERENEDLEPADVPSWLRAMRPIETVAPTPLERRESDQREEKSGPLAGLRGTLPSEPSMGGFQRPPSYIARLQPTENQERYRVIFEELIANEKEPQPARQATPISSQRVVRMVIGLILLVAILIPAVTGISFLPAPGLFPQETLDMEAAIAALPENSPVLLGFEYEPSLAGEMETAAVGVIDHLMQKGTRLAVLSTSPTGPALATRMIEQVTSRPEAYQEPYLSGEKLAMLGYLAGGPAGLMDFALRPQTAGGVSTWQQPALQGVGKMSDFGLVILITDDQQTGRTWLEQIQPRTGTTTPLLVVSSAQAAPVLSAYLDGNQVDGMVSGLAGGAIYEQLLNRSSLSTSRWQAYQLAMIASLAIIVIGALADLIMGYLADRKLEAEA